jgi:DNA modification methylase
MSQEILQRLTLAAQDKALVKGYTHNFYRYPARFSPKFASTAIQLFSKPGGIVLDPYMGGGTTVIEALVNGRRVIGTDLNSLAVFIAKAKTTRLSLHEKCAIAQWAEQIVPLLKYNLPVSSEKGRARDERTRNMKLLPARFIKKLIEAAISFIDLLPTQKSRNFVRCAILRTSQWALDGRKTQVSLHRCRLKLEENIFQMLDQLDGLVRNVTAEYGQFPECNLFEADAALIDSTPFFSSGNKKADLVVTSPPYPGLHVLYHRWQINGRRETPAPYWITNCQDGRGDSYYNFGSRHQANHQSYFEISRKTLKAIRNVMRTDAYIVQLLAFSDPHSHLCRYLENMESAGFKEISLKTRQRVSDDTRIWRNVPNRKWHANLRGNTSGSKEVVLIHRAV